LIINPREITDICLIVGISATPSLDFFPTEGMERGLIWIEVQLRYPSRD
jgi:hypothetical protein